MKENKLKLESWSLGGLFSIDKSQSHKDLASELLGHLEQGVSLSKKYKYQGKLEAWTSEIWREVYKLPKTSPGGYVMKGKVQLSELQVLKLMKGDKWQSKSGVLIEQVEGSKLHSILSTS
ncbi:hypothetical protein R1flu_017299 [Riccia fluitans]|uniref:Uncharacterized protein n=1 Tax=Riccia fluitans TaxID=41844 RepID=A0ABD1ZCJ8_9MARC